MGSNHKGKQQSALLQCPRLGDRFSTTKFSNGIQTHQMNPPPPPRPQAAQQRGKSRTTFTRGKQWPCNAIFFHFCFRMFFQKKIINTHIIMMWLYCVLHAELHVMLVIGSVADAMPWLIGGVGGVCIVYLACFFACGSCPCVGLSFVPVCLCHRMFCLVYEFV